MANTLGRDLHVDRTYCRVCGKWAYTNRRTARRVMRTVHVGEPGMNAYRCPGGAGWHVGHRQAAS